MNDLNITNLKERLESLDAEREKLISNLQEQEGIKFKETYHRKMINKMLVNFIAKGLEDKKSDLSILLKHFYHPHKIVCNVFGEQIEVEINKDVNDKQAIKQVAEKLLRDAAEHYND